MLISPFGLTFANAIRRSSTFRSAHYVYCAKTSPAGVTIRAGASASRARKLRHHPSRFHPVRSHRLRALYPTPQNRPADRGKAPKEHVSSRAPKLMATRSPPRTAGKSASRPAKPSSATSTPPAWASIASLPSRTSATHGCYSTIPSR